MSKGRGYARHKRQRSQPNVLTLASYHVECVGRWENSPDTGSYFECGYEAKFTCEECLVNGGRRDPRSGVKLGAETIWKLRHDDNAFWQQMRDGYTEIKNLLVWANGACSAKDAEVVVEPDPASNSLRRLADAQGMSLSEAVRCVDNATRTVQGPDPARKSLEMLAACVKAVLR